MKVILFGGTGMVGQGVLRECLRDPDVERVLAIGRKGTGQHDAKLNEIVRADLFDFSDIEGEMAGYDACFFCLGVTSAGMSEEAYTRITHDIAVAVGETLARIHPGMAFVFVSGAGSDSSEQGRTMWARVKGRTENALLRLPLRTVVFRPAFIQPLDGITSRTKMYRFFYAISGPLFPILRRLFPRYVTTTEIIGRAMLGVVRNGAPKPVLESADINEAGRV